MTEAEWLACADSEPMLRFLWQTKASDRKFRLFALACCHRIPTDHLEPGSRVAVDYFERYAEVGLPRREKTASALRSAATARRAMGYRTRRAKVVGRSLAALSR